MKLLDNNENETTPVTVIIPGLGKIAYKLLGNYLQRMIKVASTHRPETSNYVLELPNALVE